MGLVPDGQKSFEGGISDPLTAMMGHHVFLVAFMEEQHEDKEEKPGFHRESR